MQVGRPHKVSVAASATTAVTLFFLTTAVTTGRFSFDAAHYRNGRRKAKMEPYPVEEDGVVRPLNLLREAKPTHVVSGWVPWGNVIKFAHIVRVVNMGFKVAPVYLLGLCRPRLYDIGENADLFVFPSPNIPVSQLPPCASRECSCVGPKAALFVALWLAVFVKTRLGKQRVEPESLIALQTITELDM